MSVFQRKLAAAKRPVVHQLPPNVRSTLQCSICTVPPPHVESDHRTGRSFTSTNQGEEANGLPRQLVVSSPSPSPQVRLQSIHSSSLDHMTQGEFRKDTSIMPCYVMNNDEGGFAKLATHQDMLDLIAAITALGARGPNKTLRKVPLSYAAAWAVTAGVWSTPGSPPIQQTVGTDLACVSGWDTRVLKAGTVRLWGTISASATGTGPYTLTLALLKNGVLVDQTSSFGCPPAVTLAGNSATNNDKNAEFEWYDNAAYFDAYSVQIKSDTTGTFNIRNLAFTVELFGTSDISLSRVAASPPMCVDFQQT